MRRNEVNPDTYDLFFDILTENDVALRETMLMSALASGYAPDERILQLATVINDSVVHRVFQDYNYVTDPRHMEILSKTYGNP